jgi:hypothetical protein
MFVPRDASNRKSGDAPDRLRVTDTFLGRPVGFFFSKCPFEKNLRPVGTERADSRLDWRNEPTNHTWHERVGTRVQNYAENAGTRFRRTLLSVRSPPPLPHCGRPQIVPRALPTHVFACSPLPFSNPPALSPARQPRAPRGRSRSTPRARVDPRLFPARIPRLGACPRGSRRATRGCRSRRCARDRRPAARAATSPRALRARPEPSTARYAHPPAVQKAKTPLGKTNNTRFYD